MEKLHPGARWLFRVRAYVAMIALIAISASFIFPLIVLLLFSNPANILIIVILSSVSLMVIVIISEIYARLSYRFWKYELTPNELKLERGIIWKKYSAIPYERVQNVDIYRGILARIIGFSTLNIQTAGYHATGRAGAVSEGHIPAVSIAGAEKIREFLIKKIGRRQGL